MKLDLESFLRIGITLADFKRIGKELVLKEKLNKSASYSEMSFLSIFKTLLGILYGPVNLFIFRVDKMNSISSLYQYAFYENVLLFLGSFHQCY